MVLPTFNVNLDPKQVMLGSLVLISALAVFYSGYMYSSSRTESKIQKLSDSLKVSEEQIATLESDLSAAKDLYTVQCIKREKDLCAKVVRETADNIKKLRCRICSQSRSTR